MALKNLFGAISLEETQQTIQYYLNLISNKISIMTVDTTGRLRGTQVIESGTVTTVTTLSNQTSVGGYLASYDQYCQIQGPVDAIRSKITVS